MLLFEAENHIQTRMCPSDYENMPGNPLDQMQADVMALQSIRAQIRLSELLNDLALDMQNEIHENDTYSIDLVYEILSGIRFDARFDKDGTFIPFDEEEEDE